MSDKTENENVDEEEVKKAPAREVRFTSTEAQEVCEEILRDNKIPFLSVRVTPNDIILTVPGELENVREVAELFVQPALFGVDGAKRSEDLLYVAKLDDGVGGIASTRVILYRAFAEKVYEGAGPDEDE